MNFGINGHIEARLKDRTRLRSGSLCSEFQICVSSDEEYANLNDHLNAMEQRGEGWIGWSYKRFGGITGDCGGVWSEEGANSRLVESLSRTYAQVNTNSKIVYKED